MQAKIRLGKVLRFLRLAAAFWAAGMVVPGMVNVLVSLAA